MANTLYKKPGILRAGFDYQDLIGVGVLIDFFRNPSEYSSIELDSDDSSVGHLDDIVATHSNGTVDVIQVKFSPLPNENCLDWKWLLTKRKNGKSLLRKWSDSLATIQSTHRIGICELRTNRIPEHTFLAALNGNKIELRWLDAATRKRIVSEIGSQKAAKAFFEKFEFKHSLPEENDLEANLRSLLVPSDTDHHGWLLLMSQVRRWSKLKNEPYPDGKIRHYHLAQIITKKRTKPLPQDFSIPDTYSLPNANFHKQMLDRIRGARNAITVLWGSPGRGKSTYLSYLIQALKNEHKAVIRHHYFLSVSDTTPDRISFHDIASSLIDQLAVVCPAAVQAGKQNPDQLREILENCAKHCADRGENLHIVIDGLDHVWRERANIEQLNHLFNYLTPCPSNAILIVGTQRIPESQLPNRLIQHSLPEDWIEIPPMDEMAVFRWVQLGHQAGIIVLPERKPQKAELKQSLKDLSGAFFSKSAGHPLHLLYSIESLLKSNVPFTPDNIGLLPGCPDGDIKKYYGVLWKKLSASSKKTLHLLAGAGFAWPRHGLEKVMGSFDEIRHLLDERRTGLFPFHSSLYAYLHELPDHNHSVHALLPKVEAWLKTDAPEYHRWGWHWLVQARLGKPKALVDGTTREWVRDSLAAGWPLEKIVSILSEAEKVTFSQDDYVRTLEIRTLKTRVDNAIDHQVHEEGAFLECGLRSGQNIQQILNYGDDLKSLSDEQILAVARASGDFKDDYEILDECSEELRRRVNLWIELRHRPDHEFQKTSAAFVEVYALNGKVDVARFLKFISKFTGKQGLFDVYLGTLLRARNFDLILATAKALRKQKNDDWLSAAQDCLVRCAAAEGIDLKSRLGGARWRKSPLLSCWLSLSGKNAEDTILDHPGSKMRLTDYDYGRNHQLESFFHYCFFDTFRLALRSSGPFSTFIPGVQRSALGWVRQAVDLISRAAMEMADTKTPFSVPRFFATFDNIEPEIRRNASDAVRIHYLGFRRAIIQIARDLCLLNLMKFGHNGLTSSEMREIIKSPHWEDVILLDAELEKPSPALSQSAAKYFLRHSVRKESLAITPINERANTWLSLCKLSLQYDLKDSHTLMKRASECAIGYGWRKDLWLAEVIDAIVYYNKFTGRDVLDWATRLSTIVDHITDFTDGDETDHVRSDFIDLLTECLPHKLPHAYAHFMERDEWRYAQEVMEGFLEVADFTTQECQALGRTLFSNRDLAVLQKLKSKGDRSAGALLKSQQQFLGGMSRVKDRPNYSNTETEGTKAAPSVSKYPPSRFSDFVDENSDFQIGYMARRTALKNWLRYWNGRGRGLDALHAIDLFIDQSESSYHVEEVLDDCFRIGLALEGKKKAYARLVRSHIHRHGWQSYWASSEEIQMRLDLAASTYKDKWKAFIKDTSRQPNFWARRGYSFSIGTKYLVYFLLKVGQAPIARRIIDSFVSIVEAEVADLPIGKPWL